MKIPVYQVDAFTSKAYKGNPAAVCLVDGKLENAVMQDIAEEMNLSETTFVQQLEENDTAGTAQYYIRWFTPKTEVPLCGHATLAAAKIIFDCLDFQGERVVFRYIGGQLESRRHAKGFTMDFPEDEPLEPGPSSDLLEAMGIRKYKELVYGRNTGKLVVRLNSEAEVRGLRPDFERMKSVKVCFPVKGVGVTAEGQAGYDIVSRYFNPWAGVNEDPVTGSVHTVLAPYWSAILKKRELKALQASQRSGELLIRVAGGGRLEFIGDAVVVMKGEIYL
ncbi:MAG TPA: PhzF family phenazine biosynthesis protein [Clostridia bacterium]|nr:PhzF family phenazine biosynthesis protein [Clostridia bacterium]